MPRGVKRKADTQSLEDMDPATLKAEFANFANGLRAVASFFEKSLPSLLGKLSSANDNADYEEGGKRKRKRKLKVEDDPSKPKLKQPNSAFLLYAADVRAQAAKLHPDLHGAQLLSAIGGMWREMPETEKTRYKEQNAALRAIYYKTKADRDNDAKVAATPAPKPVPAVEETEESNPTTATASSEQTPAASSSSSDDEEDAEDSDNSSSESEGDSTSDAPAPSTKLPPSAKLAAKDQVNGKNKGKKIIKSEPLSQEAPVTPSKTAAITPMKSTTPSNKVVAPAPFKPQAGAPSSPSPKKPVQKKPEPQSASQEASAKKRRARPGKKDEAGPSTPAAPAVEIKVPETASKRKPRVVKK
ncbi:hypothetical protein DFS34DRAFT_95996 [Phlyctochytrium arcticum]|nr:hypothetical protein DFS34DRAFT_95996 [Phlyctochytrium arcticum]